MKHAHNFKDITGQRFGRVVAICPDDLFPGRWYCKCDCGVKFYANGTDLRRGRTTSCGCYRAERCRELGKGGYGVGKRPRQLLAIKETPDGVRRIPGTSDSLARVFEISRSCINSHVRTGKPVRGYTICISTQ